MANTLRDNKSVKILQAARDGGYGVPGVVSVNYHIHGYDR